MKDIETYIKMLKNVNFELLSEEQKRKFFAEVLKSYIEVLQEQEEFWNYANLLYQDNLILRKELKKPSFEDELFMQ